jgi:hypothetical protein
MKKTRIPRNANGKKPSTVPSKKKFNGPTDDAEELEAIRAYDSAKVSGETAISHDRVLKRIELSRRSSNWTRQ